MRKSKQKLFENVEKLFEPETILEVGTGQVAGLLLLGDHSPSLLTSHSCSRLVSTATNFPREKKKKSSVFSEAGKIGIGQEGASHLVLANHSEEPLSVDSQGAVVTVRVHNSRDAVVSSETLPLVASKQEREGLKPHCTSFLRNSDSSNI